MRKTDYGRFIGNMKTIAGTRANWQSFPYVNLALSLIPSLYERVKGVHGNNPPAQKVEPECLEIQGYPQLYNKFETSLRICETFS